MTCLFFLEMIIVKNLFNTKKKGISITGSNTAGELAVAIERALRRCTNLNESREGRREREREMKFFFKKKFREQVFFFLLQFLQFTPIFSSLLLRISGFTRAFPF